MPRWHGFRGAVPPVTGDVGAKGPVSALPPASPSPVAPAAAPFPAFTDGALDPAHVWATQPSVRKVVGFIARTVAAVPFRLYERRADTDRALVTDHPIAQVLRAPAPGWTPYRFIRDLVVDYLLYDRWAATVGRAGDTYRLALIPPRDFTFDSDNLRNVRHVRVSTPRGWVTVDPAHLLYGHGWAATEAGGVSPMRTLATLLAEARATDEYRAALFERGARVPAVIERPADAGKWSPEARDRFAASWRAFTRGGGREGGTPILEDGMRLVKAEAFAPVDTRDLEGRRLTDELVASAFHVAPELVGARPGTYSNVDAFRQMLYGPTVGPLLVDLEQTLSAGLVRILGDDRALYVEADVEATIAGSFAEQSEAARAAAGAPWATRNEIRAMHNLPALPGGDELVVPLNVTAAR